MVRVEAGNLKCGVNNFHIQRNLTDGERSSGSVADLSDKWKLVFYAYFLFLFLYPACDSATIGRPSFLVTLTSLCLLKTRDISVKREISSSGTPSNNLNNSQRFSLCILS